MNYLNLGCGYRFHPHWINVDFVSTGKGVIAQNLRQGIPFPDNSFDVVYHSHLLEHFPKTEAESFLQQCYRILRPQGVLRVVVPDLEKIARTYLTALEESSRGSQDWALNYEWILLEMYDQTVRNQCGGEMAVYLSRKYIPNEAFVIQRLGTEARNLMEVGRQHGEQSQPIPEGQPKRFFKQIYRFLRYSIYRREVFLKMILGEEYNALQIGRFRNSGEVHQWMYDCYSLAHLLEKCGLENIIQRSAVESYVSNWSSFNLDTEPDGTVSKPDSLFIEAIKPAA